MAKVSTAELIREIFRTKGMDTPIKDVQQEVGGHYHKTNIRKIRRELLAEQTKKVPPKKAAPKKAAPKPQKVHHNAKKVPYGAQSQSVRQFLLTNPLLTYEEASAKLQAQGLSISRDWFKKLRQRLGKLSKSNMKSATTPVSVEQLEQLAKPQEPPPESPSIVQAIRVGRQLLKMLAKDEAVQLLHALAE